MRKKLSWHVWIHGDWCEVRNVRGHGICVLYKTLVLHANLDYIPDALDLAEIECLETPSVFKTGIQRRYASGTHYVGSFCEIVKTGFFGRYLVFKDHQLMHICKTFKEAEFCADFENED